MKIVLLVEGRTEKQVLSAFFKRWLDPRLPHPVGIQVVQFQGFRAFEKGFKKKAEMHLNRPAKDQVVGVDHSAMTEWENERCCRSDFRTHG